MQMNSQLSAELIIPTFATGSAMLNEYWSGMNRYLAVAKLKIEVKMPGAIPPMNAVTTIGNVKSRRDPLSPKNDDDW